MQESTFYTNEYRQHNIFLIHFFLVVLEVWGYSHHSNAYPNIEQYDSEVESAEKACIEYMEQSYRHVYRN